MDHVSTDKSMSPPERVVLEPDKAVMAELKDLARKVFDA